VNLFIVGWGLSPERIRRTIAELHRTAALFPMLDHDAAWHRELPGGVLVGSVPSPASISAPRQYVHDGTSDGAALTLYDGLPINPVGSFAAHRAEELDANWERVSDALEGRFCLVRVRAEPLEIQLVTDACGVEQVYVHEDAGSSLVSNSAGLIQRALGLTELDPLGVSLFLALDWVGGDRTLRRAVTVAPGAQHWTWRSGDRSWAKRTFWQAAAAAGRPVRMVDRELVDEVVEPLTRFCTAAARVTGSVNAPLSGGRDSRLLAAILIAAGIPARYWTKGDAGSLDVGIGGEVARLYGLPHRFSNRPTQALEGSHPTRDIGAEWETLSQTFVAQNDGLASLYNVGNIQGQPDRVERLEVTFTAMCAEAARAPYGAPYLTAQDASVGRTSSFLAYMLTSRPRGLVRPEAFRLARRHVQDLVRASFEEGAAAENLTTMFYLAERCRRYGANNPRELAQTEDKVVPFQTRAYVESALSILPKERSQDRLHHEVMRILVPGLESVPPFDKPSLEAVRLPGRIVRLRNGLMPRLPYVALRALVAARDLARPPRVEPAPYSPYDEESWLETNLDWARDVCLSNRGSALWSFIDRRRFERLLSPDTSAPARRLFQYPIFATMTMFEFERVERTLLAQDPKDDSCRQEPPL
jgi:asparagine synthase (glutamine-hydrolysing)